MRIFNLLFCFVIATTTIGCGGENYGLAPVSGTVFFNGKPLSNATVIFAPEVNDIRVAIGTTNNEGKYQLTSFRIYDGARIGKHIVTIRAFEDLGGPFIPRDDNQRVQGKMVTPISYANPETSNLFAEVEKKNNIINFQLAE